MRAVYFCRPVYERFSRSLLFRERHLLDQGLQSGSLQYPEMSETL
jgi:hypothetical protein